MRQIFGFSLLLLHKFHRAPPGQFPHTFFVLDQKTVPAETCAQTGTRHRYSVRGPGCRCSGARHTLSCTFKTLQQHKAKRANTLQSSSRRQALHNCAPAGLVCTSLPGASLPPPLPITTDAVRGRASAARGLSSTGDRRPEGISARGGGFERA